MSPTRRSLALLRGRGYRVAVVEHWNPHARCRQDLFGVIDLLAVKEGETLGVQCTSGLNNAAKRVAKLAESDAVPDLRKAGWRLEVHGWRKLKAGWTCKIIDCS